MMKGSPFTIDQEDPGGRVGISTFLKAPISQDLDNVEVGIIGIPFDGACIDSPGTRYGPRSIRNMSWAVTNYNLALQINPFKKHKIADCGDVLLNPWSVPKASKSISEAINFLLTKNILPVIVGGDHFITYPILKAISQKHGPVAVVHFDSHLDTADVLHGERYHNASVFRRGIEEGFIIPDKLLSIGIRRIFSDESLSFHKNHNSRVITNIELKKIGYEGFKQILQSLGDVKVYVTFDVDFVDPAFAPGVGAPEPGGFTSFEALQFVRCLEGLNIIGADLVEISPPLDVRREPTALLGVKILYEIISVLP